MATMTEAFLREQLLDRRRRLESAVATLHGNEGLASLLDDVDAALQKMDDRVFGICETCREPIENDRLMANPLVRYCLDHLTPQQRTALEYDLQLASSVQKGLLPKEHFHHAGWETYYHYRPLGAVSGDYCDVITMEHPERVLFFFVGDASGKGVAASMLMVQVKSILRTLATTDLPVQELVERTSRILCETTMAPHFVTLVCGRASSSGEITICNAGHCPPLLLHGGEVKRLEATGVPVGMFGEAVYSAQSISLQAGDSLILYTDGLSEAHDGTNLEYGVSRLVECLSTQCFHRPDALVRSCLEDLRTFLAGEALTDDLMIMAVQREGRLQTSST